MTDEPRNHVSEQGVLALIAPLDKLGRFQAATYFFQVDMVQFTTTICQLLINWHKSVEYLKKHETLLRDLSYLLIKSKVRLSGSFYIRDTYT
jgi:hypothetical protein